MPASGLPALSHALSPGAVLAVAAGLYGKTPDARLLAVRGHSFAVGEGLTARAEENLGAGPGLPRGVPEGSPVMTTKTISVVQDLLATNKQAAAAIRAELRARGILGVNLLSSPGSGKTTLLEALADRFRGRYRMAVIEGDIETERDAERIRAKGVPAWQITTGGACHLEAKMIGKVLGEVPAEIDFLFIENVGNLVCPASYDLGEDLRLVLLSSPEGDDKPAKYPQAFLSADALVLTKADLLPYLPFDPARAAAEALSIKPGLKVFAVSALRGDGVDGLAAFLVEALERLRSGRA